MSEAVGNADARLAAPVPSNARVLRRLFLTLFLRGRSSRGIRKGTIPKSIGTKLFRGLFVYALIGWVIASSFKHQRVIALSLYLDAMTFAFIGLFVAASTGEILFNKEEPDILLHRPVTARELLWAKVAVMMQVSLWLAGAFNLAGFFMGVGASDGGWLYLPAHAVSTSLEALFCAGCVVMAYQLCLRWFGRERLDGLMTTAQVFMAVVVVMAGQIIPRLMYRYGGEMAQFNWSTWWIALLPPAWFAGLDDAVAGSHSAEAWVLSAVGLVATAAVLWLAFVKLAADYAAGLQKMNERSTVGPERVARRRRLHALANIPPLSWWLRDSVTRASFLLCVAYLLRDRDVKLRVYPSITPMLVVPVVFLIQDYGHQGIGGLSGFGIFFSGAYLALVPMLSLNILQYSQQWQASDLFRAAPMAGPWPLSNGALKAVLLLLTLPLYALLCLLVWVFDRQAIDFLQLLPGLIALPVFALLPTVLGRSVPLSKPTEEAKSAGRGLIMGGATMLSLALAGIAVWSSSRGWFGWFLLIEATAALVLYVILRFMATRAKWDSME